MNWEDIVLEGRLIEETAIVGQYTWGGLGEDFFTELALSALTWPFIKSFPEFMPRIRKHLLAHWMRGYYKSTMIEFFRQQMLADWRTHRIKVATVAAMRGSVSVSNNHPKFTPPGIIKGDIISIPEFHTVTAITSVSHILLEWLGDGDIDVSLIKIGGLSEEEILRAQAAWPDIVFGDGEFSYHTDSIMWAACHTQTRAIRTFNDALYDRLTILYYPEERMTIPMAQEVMKSDYVSPPEELVKAWGWYGRVRFNCSPPRIPADVIDRMHYRPRMMDKAASTMLSYAVAMQPMLQGGIKDVYDKFVLPDVDTPFECLGDESLFDKMKKHVAVYQAGEDFLLGSMGNKRQKDKSVRDSIEAYVQSKGSVTKAEVAREFNKTSPRIQQIFKSCKNIVKVGSYGPGVRWEWRDEGEE